MESQGTSREGGSWTPLNLLANSPSRAAMHIVLGRECLFITRSQKGSETQTGTKGKSRAEGGLEYGKQPPLRTWTWSPVCASVRPDPTVCFQHVPFTMQLKKVV